jgi:hypothetical protein
MMSGILNTSMKRKFVGIFVLVPLVLSFFAVQAPTAHAQASCLQAFHGADLKKTSENVYTVTMTSGTTLSYWITQQQYLYNDGTRGTWKCATSNAPEYTAGTKLPSCVVALKSLKTTDDPNEFRYSDSTYGIVSLWLSNKRYTIQSTGQIGNWACDPADGRLALVGAKQPSDLGNNPPPQQSSDLGNNPPSITESTDAPLKIRLKNPLKVNTIQDAIKTFMDTVIKIAIPFIVVFFIWTGLQFILAQGNPTKLEKAKKMFWYTVIGTLLILGAWAITDAIVGTINSIAS